PEDGVRPRAPVDLDVTVPDVLAPVADPRLDEAQRTRLEAHPAVEQQAVVAARLRDPAAPRLEAAAVLLREHPDRDADRLGPGRGARAVRRPVVDHDDLGVEPRLPEGLVGRPQRRADLGRLIEDRDDHREAERLGRQQPPAYRRLRWKSPETNVPA